MQADITIVGAGVAGCTAAIALAPAYKVILIDKHAEPTERIGESLPPTARRVLKRLGLASDFEGQSHLVSQGMQSCWGGEQLQVNDSLRNPDGSGWHLDRTAFENFLRTTAQRRGALPLWPTRIAASELASDCWQLTTDTGERIQSRWVIDASGRAASFARGQGARKIVVDHLAACWTAVPDRGTSGFGQIAAVENGWWYSAPVPGNKRIISFQTDSDLLDAKIRNSAADFFEFARQTPIIAKVLHDADAHRLREPQSLENQTINVVSASSTRLERVVGTQWLALGDAALSFDPLSSQGMFHAMASALQMADLFLNRQSLRDVYPSQIERVWLHYLEHRRIFYQQEQRWSDRTFWQRRH